MRPLHLLPDESLLWFEPMPLAHHDSLPSADETLARLCGTDDPAEIGLHGPSLAATVSEANRHEPELRLFEAVFGRDSLRVALLVADRYPQLVEATVRMLAAVQGERFDEPAEEEPGRIPHEVRDPNLDPVARRLADELGWGWPYYGSIDASCLFVLAALRAGARRPTLMEEPVVTRGGTTRTVREATVRAAAWVAGRVRRHDGLFCWQRAHTGGIQNQVWKDSPDAYFHADGEVANHRGPIASVDTQALAYDALAGCVEHARLLRLTSHRAAALSHCAAQVRAATLDRFWVDDADGAFFALGIDTCPRTGAWRPMRVRSSNVGHLLDSTLLDPADFVMRRRRDATVELLTSDELLTPNGLSTVGRSTARWRPGAYHNGSVWLWDSHVCALGLRRHAAAAAADDLDARILQAIERACCYPEYVSCEAEGSPLMNDRIVDTFSATLGPNRVEQPPQELQAWTVASAVSIRGARLARAA